MDVLKDLYQQLIIDHNQNPRNFNELKGANHSATGHNPLCGDELNVYLIIQNHNIKEITFTGSGCAISKASASIMTNTLKGMDVKDAEMKFKNFLNLATTGNVEENMGKLSVLAGVHKYPARVKCATLAWHTFYGALNNIKELIKTE
ncbi:MAG: SUF system NifU family Fe-S cluster assembly protein [Candidatus Neomarinimicrobiota bacterium]|nr:SUF system NifU family Fe-S cluster assembly protein [Candidatus Neomarinimicrobiota bacterium]